MLTENILADSDKLISDYAQRLLDLVLAKGNRKPRTYGFEYEFLPHRILDGDDFKLMGEFLKSHGFADQGGVYAGEQGSVVFEPGGQIEFLSPPLNAADTTGFRQVLEWISSLNALIEEELGIEYCGTGYIPGRYSAPLLLTGSRYRKMHERFQHSGSRGPDMMKGTAAIHLHAAMTSAGDIERFYPLFCELASGKEFGMSAARRAIWDNTDDFRCGLPLIADRSDVHSILRGIVGCALQAVELESGESFIGLEGSTFEDFRNHLTTMFTDVRVNAKGGTMELRTPDSRPLQEFQQIWTRFIELCEG